MKWRTPEQIAAFVKANEHRMDRPQQLLGDEPNSYRREWTETDLHVCLFACWAYDQAAGNVAIPTVYRAVNEHDERYLCDRSYFPATIRDLKTFESADMPIFGVESRRPIGEFDVIASSVSYPVLAVNFVKQLQMSGIPVSWQQIEVRGKPQTGRWADPERWPFVMVGGQSYGAPEVLANVVDAWWCGEAEDEGEDNPGIGEVMDRVALYKRIGRWQEDRLGCYADMAREFRFLYFPRWYEIDYAYAERPSVHAVNFEGGETRESKQVASWKATLPGMRAPVVKRFVSDLDNVPALDNPPLLYSDPGSGVAAALEVQRGCPAWCSFCALTYRQKPYRQRSVETTVAQAKGLVANTGSMHVAPFGPDFPMHTQKKRLVKELLEQVTDEVDASSMRVDDFTGDHDYALLQAYAGMNAVTLGVEGNSQRMRDLVGKGVTDEEIKLAVTRAIHAGIGKVKLYMIASLPGEAEGDILSILDLARDLAEIRDSLGAKTKIQFSWTPLLIEANTPMQWFAPTNPNWFLGEVWEQFKELRISVKMGAKAARDRYAFFQGSQRASREAGLAMIEAVADKESGCWGGAPRGLREGIEDRLRAHGFHNGLADLFDERDKADMFGWEMIDQAINPEMMWLSYQQMREFLELTSAETYDGDMAEAVGGNEWIERCDDRCYGKAQPLTSQVLTPSGFVPMGSLCIGDAVVDPEGEISHVVGVYPQGERAVYRVTFSDGSQVRATGDHLWKIEMRVAGEMRDKVLTTEEIRALPSWRMPRLVRADALSATDLGDFTGRLDPYLVGALLGDGSLTADHTPTFSSADPEIIDALEQALPPGAALVERPSKGAHREVAITGMTALLRSEGLYPSHGRDKVVPTAYKVAPAEVRLAVLQGLMDTDGSAAPNGMAEHVTISRALHEDVVWLARSLGLRVTTAFKETGFAPAWRAFVYQRPGGPRVFRLARKAQEITAKQREHGRRFVNIEPDGVEPTQCIAVSASSSLYVTDDFVPTHNTCGVCRPSDLQHRRAYIGRADGEFMGELSEVKVIDQRTTAATIRFAVEIPEDKRVVGFDYWRYAVRRAAYLSEVPIAKRTVRFAGEHTNDYRDLTHGRDYVEFSVTRRPKRGEPEQWMAAMNERLSDLRLHEVIAMPAGTKKMRDAVAGSLFSIEMPYPRAEVQKAVERYDSGEEIPMVVRIERWMTGLQRHETDVRTEVRDMWIVPEGHRTHLRMIVTGAASPYDVVAALMDLKSWVDLSATPARRMEVVLESDDAVIDAFRPACATCGAATPVNPFDSARTECFRCADGLVPA